jgi:hypothetical protein
MHKALIGVEVICRTDLKVINSASHEHRTRMAWFNIFKMFVHLFFSSSMVRVIFVYFQYNIGMLPTVFQSSISIAISRAIELTGGLDRATLWNVPHSQAFQPPSILSEKPHQSSRGRTSLAGSVLAFPPLILRLSRGECLCEKNL